MTLYPASKTDREDLYNIFSDILPTANKWKNIGLSLRLSPTLLDSIDKKDAKDYLLEVLTQWLAQNYNVQEFGKPSWTLLVKAVSDQAGGSDRALAEKLARKHQGIYIYNMVCINSCDR